MSKFKEPITVCNGKKKKKKKNEEMYRVWAHHIKNKQNQQTQIQEFEAMETTHSWWRKKSILI